MGALGSVAVDAAFGEVVGASAGDDEDAPAEVDGTDLCGGGRISRGGIGENVEECIDVLCS